MNQTKNLKMASCDKRRNLFVLLVVFCGFKFTTHDVQAINAIGYIINANSDTIYGTILLSRFNQVTGGFELKGIELESFHSRVVFKSHDEKRFQTYFPEMIRGFGFNYKSTDYIFQRFTVNHNSLIVSESQRPRFLCLVYEGSFNLYKDVIIIDNPIKKFVYDQHLTYHDYFLYSQSKGLLKAEKNDHYKTISDLLRQYEFDESFIHLIPENVRFKDIKALLFLYDRWLLIKKNGSITNKVGNDF